MKLNQTRTVTGVICTLPLANFSTSPCPKPTPEYVNYNNRFYRAYTDQELTKDDAFEYCKNEGARLLLDDDPDLRTKSALKNLSGFEIIF